MKILQGKANKTAKCMKNKQAAWQSCAILPLFIILHNLIFIFCLQFHSLNVNNLWILAINYTGGGSVARFFWVCFFSFFFFFKRNTDIILEQGKAWSSVTDREVVPFKVKSSRWYLKPQWRRCWPVLGLGSAVKLCQQHPVQLGYRAPSTSMVWGHSFLQVRNTAHHF